LHINPSVDAGSQGKYNTCNSSVDQYRRWTRGCRDHFIIPKSI